MGHLDRRIQKKKLYMSVTEGKKVFSKISPIFFSVWWIETEIIFKTKQFCFFKGSTARLNCTSKKKQAVKIIPVETRSLVC